jgi:hypothetical protein
VLSVVLLWPYFVGDMLLINIFHRKFIVFKQTKNFYSRLIIFFIKKSFKMFKKERQRTDFFKGFATH